MWYAIIGAAGLAVGIGLMIWALRERSARHKAERTADEADLHRKNAVDVANSNRDRVMDLERQIGSLNLQLNVLRGRLNEARTRLAKCGDPRAVKEWLDAELGEETIG